MSVVFVLLLSCRNFGRKTFGQVVAESVETVEDVNDDLLDGERGDGDNKVLCNR